ncbi:hypothetical protein [Oceanitalea stevensii]|uniref:Glycoside hydrolase family 15 n=1 Tax=Oceanitalea stevensii TaxID=2763072 RepID=A0ABR8Z4P4_9MICO|nr:hypothetical protein [Oceanitalea stevensii]MBD8063137.1 hypothetical protein [Oceanitalea stevensii]
MRGRLLAAVASAALALTGAAVPAAGASAAQPDHTHANVAIHGPGHAGAQSFVPRDDELDTVAAWLVSRSTSGQVTASVRTDVTDPATEVAAAQVDLGGTGRGWLELNLGGARVTPGEEYALVLQATGTDGAVEWWGSRSAAPGSPPSWNYDRDHWGGWVEQGAGPAERYAAWDLAFYVDDAHPGCAADNSCWRHLGGEQLGVQPAGIVGTPGHPYALSAFEAAGARFVPGSSVLELADGSWLYVPEGAQAPVVVPAGHPDALAQVEESRAWLASGSVPGRTEAERAMAERALLDMRLLLQDNGAVAAAWHTIWRYSWPRDSAFTAVALARAGFPEEALRILRYNASTQRPDGTWEARTLLDGSGPPDARAWQLDANGWVPWATWQYLQVASAADRDAALAELYPTVEAAADHAAASLDENGIPPARPDYWESGYPAPNLGTAAPLLAGLRAAAAIAELAGEEDDADRWFAAADRLQWGIDHSFGGIGYQRTVVDGSGKDSAVAWLAPPFNPVTPVVRAELDTTWEALVQDTGGVQPGERWGDDMTWTPETMFFALAWAADGQDAKAERLVEWMDAHRTEVGAYPEKVGPDGNPAAVATLGWTASLTVLTLTALDGSVPTPPAGTSTVTTGDDAATDPRSAAPAPLATPDSVAAPWLLVLALAAAAVVVGLSRRRRR